MRLDIRRWFRWLCGSKRKDPALMPRKPAPLLTPTPWTMEFVSSPLPEHQAGERHHAWRTSAVGEGNDIRHSGVLASQPQSPGPRSISATPSINRSRAVSIVTHTPSTSPRALASDERAAGVRRPLSESPAASFIEDSPVAVVGVAGMYLVPGATSPEQSPRVKQLATPPTSLEGHGPPLQRGPKIMINQRTVDDTMGLPEIVLGRKVSDLSEGKSSQSGSFGNSSFASSLSYNNPSGGSLDHGSQDLHVPKPRKARRSPGLGVDTSRPRRKRPKKLVVVNGSPEPQTPELESPEEYRNNDPVNHPNHAALKEDSVASPAHEGSYVTLNPGNVVSLEAELALAQRTVIPITPPATPPLPALRTNQQTNQT